MAAISQTTFSNIFSWMKSFQFIWNLFQLTMRDTASNPAPASFCDWLFKIKDGIASVATGCGLTWPVGISVIFISHWQSNPLHSLNGRQLACRQSSATLHWRHNGRDGVSNHRRIDCVLNSLFRRRSKKTSKLRVTGLCEGNSPVAGEFPAQRVSNAVNASIWWRHHEKIIKESRMPRHSRPQTVSTAVAADSVLALLQYMIYPKLISN